MKQGILWWNTFTLVWLNFIAQVSHQWKSCVYRQKIYFLNFNSIIVLVTHKAKTKNIQKDQNRSEWNDSWKAEATKVHVITHF